MSVSQPTSLDSPPSPSPLAKVERFAPNVLLLGDISSGKTHSIRTLVECGVTVFYQALEPGFEEVLGDIPPDKLHWNYIPSYKPDFNVVKDITNLLNTRDHDTIQKMGGINKAKYTQVFDLLKNCNNFVCQRDGKEYGSVTSWDSTRAFVIDGFSGLNNIFCRAIVGDKPFLEPRDYQAIQFDIEQFINTACQGTKCWFVLTAHTERETDEQTGISQMMVSTIGRKLAPRIPRFFSEVIYCKRIMDTSQAKGARFVWDTTATEVRTKTRNLPYKADNVASFVEMFKTWSGKDSNTPVVT